LKRTSLLALALFLALAAPAAAETKTETFVFGPITVGPYQVKQAMDFGIPKPAEDAYITKMDVDIVDGPGGAQVPIDRLMLHHVVFGNVGRLNKIGERRDHTCNEFMGLDNKTFLPGVAERFYAAGEERAKLILPEGYGYQTYGNDTWFLTWMLMNHRAQTDTAYVQYNVTYETEPQTEVTPYWLDVKNCLSDPVYNVPGGKKKGSTHTRSMEWTVPESGRIVAGGGHVHGGAKNLELERIGCGKNARMYTSRPLWGNADHPFYNVRPILHEPGPVNMSGFTSSDGFRVSRGEKIRLDSNYDNSLPHTRVMGIMQVYMAHDESVTDRCAKNPTDLVDHVAPLPGRSEPPRFTVPLTGIVNGLAQTIRKPPGARRRVKSGATIQVQSEYFSRPNVRVRAGDRLRWRFNGEDLHNVTLASGPRGFASVNLNLGRTYAKRLKVPGMYRLFCALHPVSMTQTVKVARKKNAARGRKRAAAKRNK
jgi:plastocyanin